MKPTRSPERLVPTLLVVTLTALAPAAFAQPVPTPKPKPAATAAPTSKPKTSPSASPTVNPKLVRPNVLPKLPAPKKDPKAPPTKDATPAKKDGPKKPDAETPKVVTDGGRAAPWTAPTANQMVDANAIAAEKAGGTAESLARMLVVHALSERASADAARRALERAIKQAGDAGVDARGLVSSLTAAPLGRSWDGFAKVVWDAEASRAGLVQNLAVVGPFQDTGGGLTRAEGPEEGAFVDMNADYSWGAYRVGWRRAIPDTVAPQGLPLGLYVSPRREACSYVASKITFDAGAQGNVRFRVASAGSIRVLWDGETVATSEDVFARGLVDRVAFEVPLEAGAHLFAAKICSGSQGDDGRVRIRVTDAADQPIAIAASSDLTGIAADRSGDRGAPAATPAAEGKTNKKKAPPAARASKVKRLPTLLEAGRAGQGTRTAALVAAILRTLGGADDNRSPRAPGLLDRVAKDPGVTPDELAMAGWLSGFGANRSGWLTQAKQRAATAGEQATVAFAQRRLGEEQAATGRLDWALATLKEEPFASAQDPEARAMRAIMRSQIGGRAATAEALVGLQNVEKTERGKTPVFVVRAILAAMDDTRPELANAYARRLAALSPAGRGPSYAASFAIGGSEAYEIAVAQTVAQQTDVGALIAMGRELLAQHRNRWAREVLYTATRVSPNTAEAFEALAAAREAVIAEDAAEKRPPSDDPRYAFAARRRALDLKPADPLARSVLAFSVADPSAKPGTEKPAARPERDERFLVPATAILERVRNTPYKKGEVFDRQAHFMRVVTYHDDRRVSQLIHYAREIVVEPRTEDERFERDIPQEGDEAELLFARVHKKDGTVVQPDEQSTQGNPYVKWPELKEGDVVEVAVRSWTAGPVGRRGDAPFYFIDYVGSTETRPVLYNEVVVDSPEKAPLGIDVINGKPDKLDESKESGRLVQRYVWTKPPSVPDEPLAPRSTEILPLVVGSTYRSWNEFREWYKEAIKGFAEPDEQVKELAAQLTKGKKSQEEKLEAVFNFVADDIRYVNYVSGEQWLPNRPQQCLARRQGDCDDKAMLLISLLRAIGVEATPVLVQTRLTGMPSVLSSTKAAAPLFDHGIAFLPGKNGKPGRWLDATSPQSRLGPLPSMDARARALFIYEGDAKIVETPPGSTEDNGASVTWNVKLDAEGNAVIAGTEKHVGDWAFELRGNLVEPEARAQWLERYLLSRYLSSVDIEGEIAYTPDAGTLGYKAKARGFSRNDGEDLVVNLVGNFSFTSNLAPLAKRTLPVSLPPSLAPSHNRRTLKIEAPPGYRFAELPQDRDVSTPFGSAKVSFKSAGKGANVVTVETSVVFDRSFVPVADYAAFRDYLQKVDALFRQPVRLTREGGAAPEKKPADKATEKTATEKKPAAPAPKPTEKKPAAPAPKPAEKKPAGAAPTSPAPKK